MAKKIQNNLVYFSIVVHHILLALSFFRNYYNYLNVFLAPLDAS
jgi:hypothetical protein